MVSHNNGKEPIGGVWTTMPYFALPKETSQTPGITSTNDDASRGMALIYGDDGVDYHRVFVRDIRGHENSFNLQANGFQYISSSTTFTDFASVEEVQAVYYREVEALVKTLIGAKSVHAYQHNTRSSVPESCKIEGTVKGPAPRPHVDQVAANVRDSFDSMFSQDVVDGLARSKCRHLSVWRPLSTVQRDPLGAIDALSVDEQEDLAPFERPKASGIIKPEKGRNMWTYSVKAAERHRWWFMGQQKSDEVLIIKITDEREGERETGAPHGAFVVEGQEEGAPARESVEVRCIAAF